MRWWEIASRFRVNLDIRIHISDAGTIDSQLMDISDSGCFIENLDPLNAERSHPALDARRAERHPTTPFPSRKDTASSLRKTSNPP